MKDHAISSNEALDLPEMPKKLPFMAAAILRLNLPVFLTGLEREPI